MSRSAVLGLFIALASCGLPVNECTFLCTKDRTCPFGLTCGSDGYCHAGGALDQCTPYPVAFFHLNEGTGTTTTDSSANALVGTLGAGATWTEGRNGGSAIALDGTLSAVVDIGLPDVLRFETGSFSYMLWAKTSSTTGTQIPWYKGGSSQSNPGFDFELRDGHWSAGVSMGANGHLQPSIGPNVAGEWVHLAAVVDRTAHVVRTYYRGALARVTAISPTGSFVSMRPATIGYRMFSFTGWVDDVKIFDRALSDEEIAAAAK